MNSSLRRAPRRAGLAALPSPVAEPNQASQPAASGAAATNTPSDSRRLRRRLDVERRNRLVEDHLDLVGPIAGHYSRCTPEASEDLRQVGLLGLIRAAELYAHEQGTPFTAFARPHIRGAILHHLRDQAPAVRLPRRQAELQERLLRLEREGMAADVRAEPQAMRQALGIDAGEWALLLRQRQLNRPDWLSEEEWQDLPAVGSEAETEAEDGVEHPSRDTMDLESLLQGLEARQRRVICAVVLEGLSYRQMARRLSVSPGTVQRLLHRGLDRLRGELDRRGLNPLPVDDRGRSAVPGC